VSGHEEGLEYWTQRLHPALAFVLHALAVKDFLQRIQRIEPPPLVFPPNRELRRARRWAVSMLLDHLDMFRLPVQLGVRDRKVVRVLHGHGNLGQETDVYCEGERS
jgi:hypothetical protein